MLLPSDFLGDWRVERLIEDRRAGKAGRFDGRLRFAPRDGGLLYREDGWLRVGDAPPLAASRAYLWRWDGGEVRAFFPDGRPFHRFRPEGRGLGTDHPCGADLYRVAYDFTRWPDWEAAWDVAGPAKDYRLLTTHRRA